MTIKIKIIVKILSIFKKIWKHGAKTTHNYIVRRDDLVIFLINNVSDICFGLI